MYFNHRLHKSTCWNGGPFETNIQWRVRDIGMKTFGFFYSTKKRNYVINALIFSCRTLNCERLFTFTKRSLPWKTRVSTSSTGSGTTNPYDNPPRYPLCIYTAHTLLSSVVSLCACSRRVRAPAVVMMTEKLMRITA